MATRATENASRTQPSKTPMKRKSVSLPCLVCDKVIKDPDSRQKGQDAIMCEGDCQGWLHRSCAGISKKAFQAVIYSSDPFLCHHCLQTCHQSEISGLKQASDALKSELHLLKKVLGILSPLKTALSLANKPMPVLSVQIGSRKPQNPDR